MWDLRSGLEYLKGLRDGPQGRGGTATLDREGGG